MVHIQESRLSRMLSVFALYRNQNVSICYRRHKTIIWIFYFVECKSSSITTPEPVIPGSESFHITSTDVLVTLQTKLDYEVNDYYSLVLQVEDQTMALTGSLIIRVGYMLFL